MNTAVEEPASSFSLTPRQRRISFCAVFAHMFGIGLCLGVTFPLISIILENWGTSSTVIGLNSAMPAVSMLILGPFVSRLAAHFGATRAMLAGLFLGSTSLALMPLLPNLPAWFVLRFLFGCGLILPWVLGETWLNVIASEARRTRVVALYSACLFGGMALGPLAIDRVGTDNWGGLLIAIAAMSLAALPLIAARRLAPPIVAKKPLGIVQVVRIAPTVAGAAALAGLSEMAIYSLLPLYGLRSGLDAGTAMVLLSVLVAGAILLQYPLGWLADRWDRRRLLLWAALLGAVLPLMLPFALGAEVRAVLWLHLLLWGGVVLGFYTLGLALLGQRFLGSDLAMANATFVMLYELGSMIGPAAGGAAMDLWNPHGLLAMIAVFAAVFAGVALWRSRKKARPAASPDVQTQE